MVLNRCAFLILNLLLLGCWQPSEQEPNVSTFVFVHGAWGGGWDYKAMESLLEARGHKVYRSTLTGLGERVHLSNPDVDLDTHILDIVNVLQYEDLSDIVLIGHSYGGMVITGVAHTTPERIKHLVYLDAMLPYDGESVFDLMPQERVDRMLDYADSLGEGWKIPPYWPDWGKDVPHPLATFQQSIKLQNPDADQIPGTYILTIEPGSTTDAFSKYAERAKARGWDYHEMPTGHNAQRTMPNEYAGILLSIK